LSRSLEQWLAYQQGAHSLSIDLSLERVREVAARLGLLEQRCPAVIVAGTNGKGSTATLLAALLQACAQSVGLFTSPHLVRYNERVQVNGAQVSDAALLAAFERIEAARASRASSKARSAARSTTSTRSRKAARAASAIRGKPCLNWRRTSRSGLTTVISQARDVATVASSAAPSTGRLSASVQIRQSRSATHWPCSS